MRMRQVIFNLLDNAIKFSKGGTVTLNTVTSVLPDEQVAIEILVKDNGIGIEPDRIDHIFDPFAQSDSSIARNFGGTGLGLPIARQLTKLMGGDVNVTSTYGVGSIFSARFVFKDLTKLHKSLSRLDREDGSLFDSHLGLNVLAVDDVETNLDVLETMLTDMDCQIHKVRNGQEAIDWTRENTPDVILMDLHMPILDGISAAKAIKTLPGGKEGIPIYAWTADVTSKRALKASKVEWAGTIMKPTTRNSLMLALKNAQELHS
ncbi:ATP-binding protein [Sneathiella glossodoripedis]|uniref:ATP-binding protein n=1 Tax=Sneathiella glossodoripedis TaxID=418853 RepID=UPI0022773D71|nr:ATP-binding protein [Sneathiella glossodoripedis]